MYEITGLRNSKIDGDQLPFKFDFKLMKRQYFNSVGIEFQIFTPWNLTDYDIGLLKIGWNEEKSTLLF